MPHRPLIIYADDDPDDCLLVTRIVGEYQALCLIDTVADGEELLQYLQARTEQPALGKLPSLILLDMHMPKMSGVDVLTALRSQPAFRRIPVIGLTDELSDAELLRAYDAGINAVVSKAAGFDELRRAMQSMIEFWIATVTLPRVSGASAGAAAP